MARILWNVAVEDLLVSPSTTIPVDLVFRTLAIADEAAKLIFKERLGTRIRIHSLVALDYGEHVGQYEVRPIAGLRSIFRIHQSKAGVLYHLYFTTREGVREAAAHFGLLHPAYDECFVYRSVDSCMSELR